MSRFQLRRPSAGLVVSIIALIVALGGTSYAAFSVPKNSVSAKQLKNGAVTTQKLKNGAVTTKKLKNGSVTDPKIKNGTITGNKLKLSSLGTVPSATHASSADSSANAAHSTLSDNLSGLTRWRTTVATPGASSTTPNTATLATAGPFTIVGECYIAGSFTEAGTFIKTSQDGSYAQGYSGNDYVPLNVANGAVQISEDTADGTTATHTPDYFGPDDGSWSATSPDGSVALDGFGTQGVYLQGAAGPACSFSGYILTQ